MSWHPYHLNASISPFSFQIPKLKPSSFCYSSLCREPTPSLNFTPAFRVRNLRLLGPFSVTGALSVLVSSRYRLSPLLWLLLIEFCIVCFIFVLFVSIHVDILCFLFLHFNMSNRKGKIIVDESDEEIEDSYPNMFGPNDPLCSSRSVGPSYHRDTLKYPRRMTTSPSPEL